MAQSKYELLKRLASDREEAAAQRMGAAQARLDDAQQKLQQLEAYRDEYQARFSAQAKTGMSKTQWLDFRQFLGRLSEAVSVQQLEVERNMQRLLNERHAWQEERKQVGAFEKLIEREAQQAAQREAKREQKSSDEFAARQFWSSSRHKPS
jgi:flagellar FliJ protein